MKEFGRFHPAANFIYFVVAMGFTMFLTNLVFILLSFLAAITLSIKAIGFEKFKSKLWYRLILFFLFAIVNPITVHQGVTPLFYMNSNAFTLEATLYGVAFGLILFTMITWIDSFSELITSDKLIYLFSSIIPSIGLVISMTLRFIPRFQRQTEKIMNINKVAGDPVESEKTSYKVKTVFKMFSILLTWAFENSIDTADSMRARGYGLKGRTSFNLFKFERRDLIYILSTLGLSILFFVMYNVFNLRYYYYPELKVLFTSVGEILGYIVYAIIIFLPVIIELREELRWKSLISKI